MPEETSPIKPDRLSPVVDELFGKLTGKDWVKDEISPENLAINATLGLFSAQENLRVAEWRQKNEPGPANELFLALAKTAELNAKTSFDQGKKASIYHLDRFDLAVNATISAYQKSTNQGQTASDLFEAIELKRGNKRLI